MTDNKIQSIILCGNCIDLLKEIPDNSIQFVLADMPYGCTQNPDDKQIPLKPLWEQLWRVVKENACIALFGQGLFFVDLVNSQRKYYRYKYTWDKRLVSGFLNAKHMPLRQTEDIAIFYKKQPVYNPQFTDGKPLHSKGSVYKQKKPTNNNYGKFEVTGDERKGSTEKYPTDLLSFQKPHPSKAVHPTQKSVELCEMLIKTYTNEGDTVLDFCCGSGTTGIAAKRTGRSFIGMEISSDYAEMAKRLIGSTKDEE